ncbi:hypothetical protein ABZ816_18155 [Actinosynnema sp. NPDC047251]|uniref:Effector-associated domain-containing protein n=1 Tax=Saccharothrix espanaensis (strain ATCC 51144 / DSM 44229 / JCM 9112 / NBRC 15066 / NRRL 15764) TaxID=1179773 RepID=K0K527_SACES|nr:hypothetical protein [Saccharothrix espanaensis]CCH33416.1 hypothetical protein BN6_61640 [Saccharothrix espanaensis DSM 44229]
MSVDSPPLHHTILAIDIERWGDPARTDGHRRIMHSGLFAAVRQAFADISVEWASCVFENTGDGMLVLIPATVSGGHLMDLLPSRITAAVRRHNDVSATEARMRLRIALHEGPVRVVPDGQISTAITVACRLLESAELRAAHRVSGEPVTIMVSDLFYRNAIHHDPATEPERYRRVAVTVKELTEHAWIRSPAATPRPLRLSEATEPSPAQPSPAQPSPPERAPAEPTRAVNGVVPPHRPADRPDPLDELVEALEAVPSMRDHHSRETVLDLLPAGISGDVPRNSRTRAFVVGLVLTCRKFEGGFDHLRVALGRVEGDTIPMRRVHLAIEPWVAL